MRICTQLLLPVLVLGLVGIAEGKKAAPEVTGGTQVAESLRSAHKLLASADHDYDGHRAAAEHRVHMALKEMGLAPAVRETKRTVRTGKSHEREPQAASDAKMREALKILQGISGQTTGRGVAAHVNGAIKEINTALSIR
jgi:hypothetical protein